MGERSILLTGFPSNELARRVFSRLLEREGNARVTVLVPERFVDHAGEWLSALPSGQRARTDVMVGDVAWLDLGLSGREYLELAARVNVIHHCAAVTYSGAPLEMAEKCNVGGTYEILELARQAASLERVVHWSTIGATNDRDGVVFEDELIDPRSNPLAQTRYRAEKQVAKAREQVPVTVIRPSMLVGDSRTGRLARVEGAHLLIASLLNAPRDVPIFRPAHGSAQLQVVPIDYAVDAGLLIADSAESIGHTYHVVDRDALSLDEALVLIADILGKPQPRGGLPPALAQALLRIPGVDRLAHAQRALVDELGTGIRYDDRNAYTLLARGGLSCPPFESYVGKLVSHVERERKSDRPLPGYSLLR
ncbi:MAG: Sorbitol-6-phosphate 2-dehydrogenase [Myxococcaceae bacterium]|nr:Sorbitol-6-phosphate 2-dehydrogenase [Myxococcaceae bacterium]